MMTKELFEMALGISEPWYIEDLRFDAEQKRLEVELNFRRGGIFSYVTDSGEVINDLKAYDSEMRTWRHLNFFEHECYIHAKVPRVKLPDGKVRRIKAPWEGQSKGFTLLFEALLLQLLSAMPVKKVSELVGVSDDKL